MATPPEPVRAGPASTYDQLRREILLGELPPGGPLVELALAERYDVSRTPVREALRRLEHDGLVERAGRGMRVRSRKPEEILQIYEVRELLETGAASAAAARRGDLDVARLESLVDAMHGEEASIERRSALNGDLHRAIWSAAHNDVLYETLERLFASNLRSLETTLRADDRWTLSLAEHERIVAAILDADADAAGASMREHIRSARATRLASLTRAATGEPAP